MKTFSFYKDLDGWFIDLPEFIEQGGTKGALQMVEGADTMLDHILSITKNPDNTVSLIISLEKFEDADLLELLEIADESIGGGYYRLKVFEGEDVYMHMWLCGVTEYVFGFMPGEIFIKRV